MTDRLQRAIEESANDPDRLHQRLFFALCRDITDMTIHPDSVPAKDLLDLIESFAVAEYNAEKPEGGI